jgi:hypothetical protein
VFGWILCNVQLEYANDYNLLKPEPKEVKAVELESRVIGCNFRLRSLRIDVLGCHSRKASLNPAISREKKCETRSSAMISRKDQGI